MSIVAPGAPIAEHLTLIDCFGSQLARSLSEAPAVQEALASSGRSPQALALAANDLNQAFYETLKIPLGEIFKAACFSFAVEQPEYASARQGDAATILALPSIAIDSSHHPTIAVGGAGAALMLSFILELTLEVRGAQLLIENRHIIGARTGTTSGKVRISMSDDSHQDLKSAEFSLPSQLRFARSIDI